jgi:hypothetical protein
VIPKGRKEAETVLQVKRLPERAIPVLSITKVG